MIIKNINVKYGEKIIYEDFCIELNDNKINCIIGTSGCGKTTLLNAITDELLSNNKKVSYVFQEDRLLPWKNIYDNLRLVIKSNSNEKECNEQIDNVLKALEIEDIKYMFPNELSGGMKQKINIARALLYNGEILILDEPFKSLDIKSKDIIFKLIRKIQIDKNITVVIVTHDKFDALELGNYIFLLGNNPVEIIMSGEKTIINDVFNKVLDNKK